MTPSFLCVHPHIELYGSDRTFLQSVQALRKRWPTARITVLLTGHGELYDAMREIVDDVRIHDVFVLRRSDLGPRLILRLPWLFNRIEAARKQMAEYDVIYINTVVVLDFILASRRRLRPVLIHVHELPSGLARMAFSALLRFANCALVYISAATRKSYIGLERKPSVIVWNGTRHKADAPPVSTPPMINALLIGRFNAWKGQTLLLNALAMLTSSELSQVRVRLVGSAYSGQEHFKEAIEQRIIQLNLSDTVQVHGFDPNPDRYFAWADIVVVPSLEPEPFGLVAIEAMAAGRAVIAANHGGLTEIVRSDVTGLLVEPRDPGALRDALRRYLGSAGLARSHGAAGKARFASEFDELIYMRRIAAVAAANAADETISQGVLGT